MDIHAYAYFTINNKYITRCSTISVLIIFPIFCSLFYSSSMIPIHFSCHSSLRTLDIKICLIANGRMFLN